MVHFFCMKFLRKFVAPLGTILYSLYTINLLLHCCKVAKFNCSLHGKPTDTLTHSPNQIFKYWQVVFFVGSTMDKAEKKVPPKQAEWDKELKEVLDDEKLPDSIKVQFVSGAVQKSIESGDNSMLDMTSPNTQKLAKYLKYADRFIPSPDKPNVKRNLINDWKLKKEGKASQTTTEVQPVQDNKVRQRLLKATPPTPQHLNQVVLKTEHKKEKPAPTEQQPEVFSNVAEAQDSIGPTATLTKTNWNKQRTIFTKQFDCNGKNCKLRWKIVADADSLKSAPAKVYLLGGTHHTCLPKTTWRSHYKHLCRHTRKQTNCDECSTFKVGRGLPFVIKLWTDTYMNKNATKPPNDIAKYYLSLFQNSDLIKDDPAIRSKVKEQIITYVKKNRIKVAPTETNRMKYFEDLRQYITRHRIKLEQVKRAFPIPPRIDEPWVRNLALTLWSHCIIKPHGIGEPPDLQTLHRKLVTLHDESIGIHDRYQHLKEAKESVHKTGPDPLHRTLVFTSIALLCNVIYVMQSGWPTSVGVDGTHDVAKTDYKLLPFGYFVMKDNGSRTFYPIAYAFGEGEREVCALHLFLNINSALMSLFGIEKLPVNGGCISDRTAVFANSVQHAFGQVLLMQCYPHIIRKFLEPKNRGGREGNGDYFKHCKTKDRDWFHSIALNDVRHLHRCITEDQFNALWQLVKAAWSEKGEHSMTITFEESYITDGRYNKWRFNASGIFGCIPDNQPLEAHNKSMKGSCEIEGLMRQGRSYLNACNTEFPKLIEACSLEKMGPVFIEPILDVQLAVQDGRFMDYYGELDPNVDFVAYQNGWLVNDLRHLNEDITTDDIRNLELSLSGKLVVELGNREQLVHYTNRFHYVTKHPIAMTQNINRVCCRCSCKYYYSTKRCFASMFFQHREYLKTNGAAIPGGKKKKKMTKQQQHSVLMHGVKKRKQEREASRK